MPSQKGSVLRREPEPAPRLAGPAEDLTLNTGVLADGLTGFR
jgi:hypothetical protein